MLYSVCVRRPYNEKNDWQPPVFCPLRRRNNRLIWLSNEAARRTPTIHAGMLWPRHPKLVEIHTAAPRRTIKENWHVALRAKRIGNGVRITSGILKSDRLGFFFLFE